MKLLDGPEAGGQTNHTWSYLVVQMGAVKDSYIRLLDGLEAGGQKFISEAT